MRNIVLLMLALVPVAADRAWAESQVTGHYADSDVDSGESDDYARSHVKQDALVNFIQSHAKTSQVADDFGITYLPFDTADAAQKFLSEHSTAPEAGRWARYVVTTDGACGTIVRQRHFWQGAYSRGMGNDSADYWEGKYATKEGADKAFSEGREKTAPKEVTETESSQKYCVGDKIHFNNADFTVLAAPAAKGLTTYGVRFVTDKFESNPVILLRDQNGKALVTTSQWMGAVKKAVDTSTVSAQGKASSQCGEGIIFNKPDKKKNGAKASADAVAQAKTECQAIGKDLDEDSAVPDVKNSANCFEVGSYWSEATVTAKCK